MLLEGLVVGYRHVEDIHEKNTRPYLEQPADNFVKCQSIKDISLFSSIPYKMLYITINNLKLFISSKSVGRLPKMDENKKCSLIEYFNNCESNNDFTSIANVTRKGEDNIFNQSPIMT